MRLWAYAIVMTIAAAASGYFGWLFYSDGTRASAALAACSADLEPVRERAERSSRQAQMCEDELLDFAAQLEDLSTTKEELRALRTQREEDEKQMAAIAQIQAQFAKMIDTGQLKVFARRGGLVVELPAEVLFRSGSADLSEKGELSVLEVGFILKQFPERRFLVVGHTDNLPLKNASFQDNWELSTARALTVTHVLVKAGMKSGSLIAAGAGEHDPIGSNARPADRQRNRRIEIQLLPAIAELPPLPAALQTAQAEASK
ncbi:MAG TPA: OmpA family protein [Myxococcota bacterium]|nr:OmpA family protein [Myxococcota bacterium]